LIYCKFFLSNNSDGNTYFNLISDDVTAIEITAYVLLNSYKEIASSINKGQSTYMDLERHRGKIKYEYFIIGSRPTFNHKV
jgi:hypothetical protein